MPILLYEAGEALRFDEVAIRAGVRGVVNVMRSLGMLPGQPAHAAASRAHRGARHHLGACPGERHPAHRHCARGLGAAQGACWA